MENESNQMNSQQPMSPVQPESKKGPFLIIAIIAVLIVAALLIVSGFQKKQERALDAQIQQKQAAIASEDAQVQALQNQGTGNDPASIEADLKATNVDTIDLQ